MDWASLLYDPGYTIMGEEAVITVDALSDPVTLTAHDKTAGVELVDDNPRTRDLAVQTVVPAIAVRMSDLTDAGLTRLDLEGGQISMNSKTWRIDSSRPRPSPKGEVGGELLLLLSEA